MYWASCHLLLQTAVEGLGVCPLQLNDCMETSNPAWFLRQDMDIFSFVLFTFAVVKLNYITYVTCWGVRIK